MKPINISSKITVQRFTPALGSLTGRLALVRELEHETDKQLLYCTHLHGLSMLTTIEFNVQENVPKFKAFKVIFLYTTFCLRLNLPTHHLQDVAKRLPYINCIIFWPNFQEFSATTPSVVQILSLTLQYYKNSAVLTTKGIFSIAQT